MLSCYKIFHIFHHFSTIRNSLFCCHQDVRLRTILNSVYLPSFFIWSNIYMVKLYNLRDGSGKIAYPLCVIYQSIIARSLYAVYRYRFFRRCWVHCAYVQVSQIWTQLLTIFKEIAIWFLNNNILGLNIVFNILLW